MPTAKDAFLSRFDPALGRHLLEFGKRLTDLNTDVVMTMARKSTCLVESLERLNLASLGTIVTSDRVLDMDLAWLGGQRLTLVDDALISGTTLARTRQRLEAAGAVVKGTIVLCVNTDWWVPELARPDAPYLALGDADTISFCASIVEALSVVPTPYAVDYPRYTNIRIPASSTRLLGGLGDWRLFDVSTALQQAHDVFAHTFAPNDAVLSNLDEHLGWDFALHGTAKVRLYGRRMQRGRDAWLCEASPIVMLNPMSLGDLEELWGSLGEQTGAATSEWWSWFTSPTSRVRLIQYVVSARLARQWLADVGEALSSSLDVRQHARNLDYLFPAPAADLVRRLADADGPLFNGAPVASHVQVPAAISWKPSFGSDTPEGVRARLTEPFLLLYRERELAARRLAKKLGVGVLDNPEYKATMDRLNTGYSLPQLRALLHDFDGDAETTLSLFLDQSVDRGIVVPLTAQVADAVFRAFRHGEDVKFGETEQRLCALLINAFSRESGRVAVPHLWVEKLLVLMLKVGVQRRFLEPWLRQMGHPEIAGVRFALHGPVVKVGTGTLYDHDPDAALTHVLREAGILEYDGEHRNLYKLARIPEGGTHPNAEPQVELIGAIFGSLLAGTAGSATLTDAELILLTTCQTHSDIAGALAAEIDIFRNRWRWQAARYAASVTPEVAGELADDLRRSVVFTAVNSGQWKYSNFREDAAWKIIERITAQLTNAVYKASWRTFWPTSGTENKEAVSAEFTDLIARLGKSCYLANIYMRQLEFAYRWMAGQRQSAITLVDEMQDFVDKMAATTTPGAARANRVVHALRERVQSDAVQPDAIVQFAQGQLRDLQADADWMLSEVDVLVAPFGRERQIHRFQHAAIVDVVATGGGRGRAHREAARIIKSVRIRASRTHGQQAQIEILNREEGPLRHGTWVCASGDYARTWLIRLAAELCEKLGTIANVRVVIFPHLAGRAQLVRAGTSSQFQGPQFWARASQVDDHLGHVRRAQIVFVHEPNTELSKALDRDLNRDAASVRVKLTSATSLMLTDPLPQELTVSRYDVDAAALHASDVASPDQYHIGVLTVVTEETRALVARLREHGDYASDTGKLSRRMFYHGYLPGDAGKRHRVVCTQATRQGNRSIINAYRDLVDEFSPSLVVLLGIGGAIHKDIRLCDVVIADSVIYYDERKVTEQGRVTRGRAYELDPWLKVRLNHFFVLSGEPAAFAAAAGSANNAFNVFTGPIGSGEAVIAFRDAEERKYLTGVNDKTLVLETEAGGVAQGFYEDELRAGYRAQGYVVVRGVSDHADAEKDDKWRQPAAENAMCALERFVATLADLRSVGS